MVRVKQITTRYDQLDVKKDEKQIVIGTEGYFGTLPDGLQIYLEGILR